MRIRQQGKIIDGVWFLGREESCVYLLEGERESMMVSGGMSYLIPDLLAQFDRFELDEKRIKKILILHAHFDHVGIVPFLKRRHPDLQIYASRRGWELLSRPKAVRTINEFSRTVAKRMGKEEVYARFDPDWRDDISGRPVSEGDRFQLGGMEVHIYETPGHSSCSITAHIPDRKVLFASDGGGIPFKETILTSGNSDFTRYQESLERLRELETRYICADHYGVVAGDEAETFISTTIELAGRHRALMEETYLRTGDIHAAAEEIVRDFYREHPDYIIAPEIFEMVYRQMIRHIAAHL
jgi:2-aminobenzoylacetyl-CoA thioesterase